MVARPIDLLTRILKVTIEALTELAESVRMSQQQLSPGIPENGLGCRNMGWGRGERQEWVST